MSSTAAMAGETAPDAHTNALYKRLTAGAFGRGLSRPIVIAGTGSTLSPPADRTAVVFGRGHKLTVPHDAGCRIGVVGIESEGRQAVRHL